MNIRGKKRKSLMTGVMLSPLIDCVFLLLIFFLVTSMIKRFERQIPVTLADDTSAITDEPRDDAFPLGVAKTGRMFSPAGKDKYGVRQFQPIADPDAFLKELIGGRGGTLPVTVMVERGTSFQKVIRIQDRLELIGLKNVRFRIRDFPLAVSGKSERLPPPQTENHRPRRR